MSAAELLERLAKLGVTVSLDGEDRLAVEGPDDRVESEIESIRLNKPAIIEYLKAQRTPASEIRRVPSIPKRTDDAPAPVVSAPAALPRPSKPASKRAPPKPKKPLFTLPKWKLPSFSFDWLATPVLAGATTGAREAVRLGGLSFSRLSDFFSAKEDQKVDPGALPFQNDLTAIVEEPAPSFMRLTTYVLAAFFFSFVLIAAVVEIEIVIRGTGKLTVDGPPLVLQPIERSILRAVFVKPGEVVTKGQVLATLDPTFADADASAIETQQKIMLAQLRRLEAEARDEPLIKAGSDREETLQFDILRQRRLEYLSRLRQFDEEIKRAGAAVKTLEVESQLLEQQLVVARDVEQMRSTLFASQSGSRLQYLEARSTRIKAERDHQSSADRLVELRHDLDAKRAERQAFVDEWRRRVFEEIERLRGETARMEGAQAKARRYRELINIVAPQDGVVIDIAKRSVGSVLREAETLIVLAPTNMPLIAEVSLSSSDVGYAKAGDHVIVKVDSFPYTRHGSLKGKLRSISQESFASGAEGSASAGPPAAGSFHRAQVVLSAQELERMPEGTRLIPGMTVSAEIKVGMRTVISYFLNPIIRGFDEGLREP